MKNRLYDNINDINRIVLSGGNGEYAKLTCRRINKNEQALWQTEGTRNNQAFHTNYTEDDFAAFIDSIFESQLYKQINVFASTVDTQYLISSKGKVHKTVTKHDPVEAHVSSHNAVKNYLINEGDNVPILVELGIFTKDYKIVRTMYDKFKQINRFVEIIDDKLKTFSGDSISILDFGCGKSYLTFVAYYYFKVIKNIDVAITGYDLKVDVVKSCNALAIKYGYDKLKFYVKDVSKDALSADKIDMIMTLHACDTATDFALNYAINNSVKYIFSVPCCQHEVNNQIKLGGDADILIKYGLFKERYSALLTDAIRAEILSAKGYKVDVLEFVDLAHSPKNIMLRCVLNSKPTNDTKQLQELADKYGFSQTLLNLQAVK